MTLETSKAGPCPADFGGCLVEGSFEDRLRQRKLRRRAIAASLMLEAAGLAALLIAPILAKTPGLPARAVVPVPPYGAVRPAHRGAGPPPPDTHNRFSHIDIEIRPVPAPQGTRNDGIRGIDGDPMIPVGDSQPPGGGLIPVDTGVAPPPPPISSRVPPRRLYDPHISPALLIHRVEPVYPPLARQLRRAGRVELHAVIAVDGSIEALEVVSGDPLFLGSALEAVRQWRYRPTVLNGTPVEVDTFVSVIYTLEPR